MALSPLIRQEIGAPYTRHCSDEVTIRLHSQDGLLTLRLPRRAKLEPCFVFDRLNANCHCAVACEF
jgi:hypothetical protein